jgi:hypothetical protein
MWYHAPPRHDRFPMGLRIPDDRYLPRVCDLIAGVQPEGLGLPRRECLPVGGGN